MWAEFTVLAHLAGWPMPMPRPRLLAAFTALEPRLAQCAVSHAVDAAVSARAAALVDWMAPASLASHSRAAIFLEAACAPEEPRWRLPGAVTEAVTFGMARPSVIEAAGPVERILDDFVDCQWPLAYLATG